MKSLILFVVAGLCVTSMCDITPTEFYICEDDQCPSSIYEVHTLYLSSLFPCNVNKISYVGRLEFMLRRP